jgi:hypothetical protein
VTGGVAAVVRGGQRHRLAAMVGSFLLHLGGANEAEVIPCADSQRSESASFTGAV